MAETGNPRVNLFKTTYDQLDQDSNQGIAGLDMARVNQRQKDLSKFLGQTDYSKQLTEAQDMSKLQLALALAQQGFAAAGAPPKKGENPISTLSRELLAPVAGTAGAVATQMMQQRRAIENAKSQEERQTKLASLQQVKEETAARKDLAFKLLPASVQALMKQGNRGFVRVLGADGKPTGAVLPLQYNFDGKNYTGRTVGGTDQTSVILDGKTPTHILTNESGDLLGSSTQEKSTYKDNLVVVNKDTNKPLVDDQGNRIQVTRSNNVLFKIGGGAVPFPQPKNTKLVPVSQVDKSDAGSTETDSQRATENNVNFIYSLMPRVQQNQIDGPFTPYSRKGALYFDQGAFVDGKFAFRFIPSGTKPEEALQKSREIKDEALQKLILNKVRTIASVSLKQNFGDQSDRVKSDLAEIAIKEILSIPPEVLFGAKERPSIGYIPNALAFNPVVQAEATKEAFQELKTNPDANAYETFETVVEPTSKEAFNKQAGRLKTAISLFPQVFGDPQKPLAESYDEGLVQRRQDIEKVLPTVKLLLNTSPEDRRQIIIEAVIKQEENRNKLQNSSTSNEARELFSTRLEFRQALVDFQNAAAETGVEGFFTGTLAGGAARLGFSDFIEEEGAEAWNRLTVASDRFQEGQSRRVGKEFGDDRISNYDAQAYKKLVADISKGKQFNRVLIKDGLNRVNKELTGLMSIGGKVGWTERELKQAAEAGVDFSQLKTLENWHGYGYYGKNRYSSTRQQSPSLSSEQIKVIKTSGQLKDTMYGGKYTVPVVNYSTGVLPTFQRSGATTSIGATIPATKTKRMDPLEFETYVENLATSSGSSNNEMRSRIVNGILSYNIWRENLK